MSYIGQIKFNEPGIAHTVYNSLKAISKHIPNGYNPNDVKIEKSTVTVNNSELSTSVEKIIAKFNIRNCKKINLVA